MQKDRERSMAICNILNSEIKQDRYRERVRKKEREGKKEREREREGEKE